MQNTQAEIEVHAAAIGTLSPKIQEVGIAFEKRVVREQTAGMLATSKIFLEWFYEWRMFLGTIAIDKAHGELDSSFVKHFKVFVALLNRVRENRDPIKLEEMQTNPNILEMLKSNLTLRTG